MNGRKLKEQIFLIAGIAIMAAPFMQMGAAWLAAALLAAYIIMTCIGMIPRAAIPSVSFDTDRFSRYIHWGCWAAALVLPLFVSAYQIDVLTLVALYAILAVALNITVGYTGVFVMGFIAFYAIGAYTMALMTAKYQLLGFWTTLPLCGLFSMLCGLLLGLPALRLKGDYLAIVTLGFGEIVRLLLNNLDSFTGGPNGIGGIPRPSLGFFTLNDMFSYYYFCLLFLWLVAKAVRRLEESRYGRTWMAIRENEQAAGMLGIDVFKRYLLSFSISAFLGGIAGGLFAAKQGFVSPESFTFYESVLVLCMVVIGGTGSIAGSILGAVMLIMLPELLRDFSLYRMILFGACLIAFMIFKPAGIMGSRRMKLEMRHREEEAANAAD